MLTRLKLGFSHLEHKFRHDFKNTLKPLCPYSIKAETITHYFLRCYFEVAEFFNSNRAPIMNDLRNITIFFSIADNYLISFFFYIAMISSMTQKMAKY